MDYKSSLSFFDFGWVTFLTSAPDIPKVLAEQLKVINQSLIWNKLKA